MLIFGRSIFFYNNLEYLDHYFWRPLLHIGNLLIEVGAFKNNDPYHLKNVDKDGIQPSIIDSISKQSSKCNETKLFNQQLVRVFSSVDILKTHCLYYINK